MPVTINGSGTIDLGANSSQLYIGGLPYTANGYFGGI